jgi:hypothetical protein
MSDNEALTYLLTIIKERDGQANTIDYLKTISTDKSLKNIELNNQIDGFLEQIDVCQEKLRIKDLEIEGLKQQIEELRAEANYVAALGYQAEDGDDYARSGEDTAGKYIDDYANSPETNVAEQYKCG